MRITRWRRHKLIRFGEFHQRFFLAQEALAVLGESRQMLDYWCEFFPHSQYSSFEHF
jgi:hypothetical protein